MPDTEAKQGGTKPQIAIYQKVAAREDEIINKLFDLLDSRNESVAVSAAKTLLSKILPDRKAVEVTGENGEPIKINIVAPGYYMAQLAKNAGSSTAPETGNYGSASLPGVSMAPQSEENDNSDKSISDVGTA